MRLTLLDVLVGLAVVGLFAAALLHRRAPGGPVVLPSPMLTPGVLNPQVTPRTIRSTICVRGWTATVRPPPSYTSALKVRQLHDFALPGPASAYQEDHLISLELGGDPTD